MSRRPLLAIDPGSAESAVVLLDLETGNPEAAMTLPNEELIERIRNNDSGLTIGVGAFVCEWMQPRGMPTSAQEFETLFWIGRFAEALHRTEIWDSTGHRDARQLERLTRLKVKTHVCGSAKANDSNIRAALIDRYGGAGGKDVAIGKKATPGPLYGIAGDEWAALALAVTWADQHPEGAA